MNKLSITILHHPSREHLIPYLKEKLGNDIFVCTDTENNLVKNSRKAWMLHDESAGFHLVLDDDVRVCENFRERAEYVLSEYPNQVYSFFWGEMELKDRDLLKPSPVAQYRYRALKFIRWGCAICLRTALIHEMLAFTATVPGFAEDKEFDTRVSKYIEHKKIRCYYPIPCLVDHREDEPSLAGNQGMHRRSKYFAGE